MLVCGYIGKISIKKIDHEKLSLANSSMICRGPDNTSTFNYRQENFNFSFIFNRLKIIDLSDNANQPMSSNDHSATVMFNGEIYNHLELRNELIKKGVKFFTKNSDTEVVLNGIKFFGKSFLDKLRGQFSICYFDHNSNKVLLISDRLNQKPLYYTFENGTFSFSSNLKSLLKAIEHFSLEDKYIQEYLMYGIVSSPNTIFKNISKMSPAQVVEVDLLDSQFKVSKNIYWRPESFLDDKQFIEDEFFELFNEAVHLRKTADVPVANFLSGGIDSTSIIKNIADKNEQVNSFSVVFDEKKYNEQKWSRQVVKKYDTNHFEINASKKIGIFHVNEALKSLDEPYSDPSVVPSYMVSNEVSKYYKVAISGDGGDELLGGYERTKIALKNRGEISNLVSKIYNFYPGFLGTGNYFLTKSNDIDLLYRSFFKDEKFFRLLNLDKINNDEIINIDTSIDLYKAITLQDYKYYLPEMMMFKIDRTSMFSSVEVRSPFVDHKLVEYILSTKLDRKMQKINKNVLKNYLLEDFNEEFVNRKKRGFVFDLESWVFSNIKYIESVLGDGSYFSNIPKTLIPMLSIYKSRINANRIWRLFVLEQYLKSI